MSAVASMMALTGALGGGGDPVEFAYRGSVNNTSNGPSFTFSVPSAVPTDCLMVVAVGQEGCGTINSFSGGGYTWTKVVTTGIVGSQNSGFETAIYAAEITSKPSSVSMTCNDSGFRANAAFYSVINHSSATPVATANFNSSNQSIATAYLNNLNDGDAVIAYCTHETQGNHTWLNLTRDFYSATSENRSGFSSASLYRSGAGQQMVRAQTAAGAGRMGLVTAAWR